MISKRVFLAAALLAVCGLVVSANAANVTVTPLVVAGYNLAGEPVDIGPVPTAQVQPQSEPLIYQVEFYMSVADLAGPPSEVGFGNVVFNANLGPGLSDTSLPGWLPVGTHPITGDADARTRVDANGPAIGGLTAKWADNADLGTGGDLIDIVVGTAPADFNSFEGDPRRHLGQGPSIVPGEPGDFMGTLMVDWDGTGMTELIAEVTAWSTYDAEPLLSRNDGGRNGGSVVFGVPEPTALVLFGFGGLLMTVIRRKRS